jgi:transcriptional regulator with XRE-family HTH domain
VTWLNTTECVAEYTRQIINHKGLKQKKVAEKAGYTQQAFSNLLNGRKFFGANDILRIAKALDVTPNELFGIKNDSKSKEEPA